MNNGRVVYECRRCKEVLKGTFVKDIGGVLRADLNKINRKFPMYKIHYCKDGGVGIADLIGGEPSSSPQKGRIEDESQDQQFTDDELDS